MNQDNNNQTNNDNQIKNPFLNFQPVQTNQDDSIPYLNKEQGNPVSESPDINNGNAFEPINTNIQPQGIIDTQQNMQPIVDSSVPQQTNVEDDHSIINTVMAQQANPHDSYVLPNLNEMISNSSDQITPNTNHEENNINNMQNINTNEEDKNKKLLDNLLSRDVDSNQTPNINNNNDNNNNNKENKDLNNLGIIILALAGISLALFILGLGIVSLAICAICLIGGLINIKRKNKLILVGTIVAGLLLIIYTIIIFVAVGSVNDHIDNTKKDSFIFQADSFIYKAQSYVNKNYVVDCGENNTILLTYQTLKDEDMDDISPWGEIDQEKSFVKVVAEEIDGKCEYKYYVYLTDGKYSIGDQNNPIEKGKLDNSVIK